MKRLLAALTLTAFCAVGLASYASAQNASVKWVIDDLTFYNSQNNAAGKTEVDSVYASGNAARFDTLNYVAPIDKKWWVPQGPVTATVDSLIYCTLYVYPAANVNASGTSTALSTAADSIYLQTQVSMDGRNWITTTPTSAFQAANTVNTTEVGMAVLEQASSNTFAFAFKQAHAVTSAATSTFVLQGGSTAPTNLQLALWPYVRWIIGWGGTGTGAFRAKVGHYILADPD